MPLYQQIIVALPGCANEILADLFRQHAKIIIAGGINVFTMSCINQH